jgi:hypothetical protein
MPRRASPYMIGRYGMGILSCLKSRDGLFILFNAKKIAQRYETGAWTVLETGWKITTVGTNAIQVQLNDSDGVVVSLHRG